MRINSSLSGLKLDTTRHVCCSGSETQENTRKQQAEIWKGGKICPIKSEQLNLLVGLRRIKSGATGNGPSPSGSPLGLWVDGVSTRAAGWRGTWSGLQTLGQLVPFEAEHHEGEQRGKTAAVLPCRRETGTFPTFLMEPLQLIQSPENQPMEQSSKQSSLWKTCCCSLGCQPFQKTAGPPLLPDNQPDICSLLRICDWFGKRWPLSNWTYWISCEPAGLKETVSRLSTLPLFNYSHSSLCSSLFYLGNTL